MDNDLPDDWRYIVVRYIVAGADPVKPLFAKSVHLDVWFGWGAAMRPGRLIVGR